MNIFEQIAKLKRKFQWISTDHLDSTINIFIFVLSSACLFIHSSPNINLCWFGPFQSKLQASVSCSVLSSCSLHSALGIFSFFESVRLFYISALWTYWPFYLKCLQLLPVHSLDLSLGFQLKLCLRQSMSLNLNYMYLSPLQIISRLFLCFSCTFPENHSSQLEATQFFGKLFI